MMAAKLKQIDNDHTMPFKGQQIEKDKARSAALDELRTLAEQVEVAGIADKAKQQRRLKATRPRVTDGDRQRIEKYMMYLSDKGISTQELVERNSDDPEAVAVLMDLAPVLAQAERPNDRDAANGLADQLSFIGLDVFGDDYRKAYDEVQAADKVAYLAGMSVNQAIEAAEGKDDTPVFVDVEGKVIGSAA